MNGQVNNYNSYMQQTYSPIDVNTLPYFVNMKALRNYAKEKGVPISSLADSEKEQLKKRNLASSKVNYDEKTKAYGCRIERFVK
ncbi:MAG: HMG-CoA synthase [Treponema sp.]|nr:HMG-CoA synthase [Treponema sp.]